MIKYIFNSTFIQIGISIGAKGVLFVLVASLLYREARPEETILFLQLLFLQSSIVGFLSAAGYFTAFKSEGSDQHDEKLLSSHILLTVLGLMLVSILVFLGVIEVKRQLEFFLVLAGAVATGFAAPLTGICSRRRGPKNAFLPATLLASFFILVAVVPSTNPVLKYYFCITIFQVLVFLVLVFQLLPLVKIVVLNLNLITWEKIGTDFTRAVVFGTLNSASLGFVLWFRELWSKTINPETVSSIFLVFRISDALFQVVTMMLASHSLVNTLVNNKPMRSVGLTLAFTLASLAGLFYLDGQIVSALPFAIIAQGLLDVVRFPLSLVFVYLMREASVKLVATYSLGSMLFASVVVFSFDLEKLRIGYHLFAIATGVAASVFSLIWIAISRRNTEKHVT